MASVTATAKPDAPPQRWLKVGPWPIGSRLGRLIVALNLLGLAILIGGALVLNELRRGLIDARVESLTTEGQVIANVIDQTATVGEPEPSLEADTAASVLQSLSIPKSQRVRLFDAEGHLLADSYIVADRVEAKPLPPAKKPGDSDLGLRFNLLGKPSPKQDAARDELAREVGRALRAAPRPPTCAWPRTASTWSRFRCRSPTCGRSWGC
jgi:two-component system sensor histidine kinase ChvG